MVLDQLENKPQTLDSSTLQSPLWSGLRLVPSLITIHFFERSLRPTYTLMAAVPLLSFSSLSLPKFISVSLEYPFSIVHMVVKAHRKYPGCWEALFDPWG